jgi:hypothetical protein
MDVEASFVNPDVDFKEDIPPAPAKCLNFHDRVKKYGYYNTPEF